MCRMLESVIDRWATHQQVEIIGSDSKQAVVVEQTCDRRLVLVKRCGCAHC